MKNVNFVSLALCLGFFIIVFPVAEAETIKQTMEGSLDLEINHPDSVINGRTFSVSILLKNNGWEDKQEISIVLTNPDGSIVPVDNNEIKVDRLSTGGSYGRTIDFKVLLDASQGTHFLNVLYSQVLVSNNEDPLAPVSYTHLTLPTIYSV